MTQNNTITCNHCKKSYTIEEYKKLKKTEYNIIWDYDYRICRECGEEITPVICY